MKIIYIIDEDINSDSGIIKKIAAQIKYWQDFGNTVYLFIVSNDVNKQFIPNNINRINLFSYSFFSNIMPRRISKYLNKNIAFYKTIKQLKNINPDIVYYRQSYMWYWPLQIICSKFKVIMEVNTLDVNEKNLSSNFMDKFIYINGQHLMNKKVKGIVAVTGEIAQWYQKYNIPMIVIANGIFSYNKDFKKNNSANKRPQLLFIGSERAWHGVEKIYYMAEKLIDFDFHIVGIPNRNNINLPNLKFHGYINDKNIIEEIYSIADIGIGTLSLYVKKMEEACPLKVREYLAHKLPVILGYNDVDLMDENNKLVLNIGNYPDNVKDNIDNIKNFVLENKEKSFTNEDIDKLVGSRVKEENRISFFKSISSMN